MIRVVPLRPLPLSVLPPPAVASAAAAALGASAEQSAQVWTAVGLLPLLPHSLSASSLPVPS